MHEKIIRNKLWKHMQYIFILSYIIPLNVLKKQIKLLNKFE